MEKNEILRIYGTDHKKMTKTLLAEADLAGEIPGRDTRIGIKPNLLAPTPASYGATTHPEVVAGIIEYLQERDFRNIIITEGSWVGDRTAEAYEYCGYRELCEKYGVEFVDTQKDSAHTVNCAGMKIKVCDVVDRIDFLINVPVLKGHCQTKITCALKNNKGLIPNSEKRRFHSMGLHKPIAHLGAGIRQDFIVIDHICGDLDFEEGGRPVTRNCVMAARDPVLIDAWVCRMLGYSVDEVPYVRLAERLGVGSADTDKARVLTLDTERGRVAEEPIDPRHRVLDVMYAVEEVDSCSACYASLIPALDRLKEEGLLDRLNEKVAIGQGYKGKRGRLGVGACTAGFDFSIKGCPPTEEEVYRGLRDYIFRSGR
ncbi:MAG: DUF362 domain-containing protein [Clostridiales bacterium]|nr:DUF362 domain-containing protein [Clostridiales bacterium]